MGEDLTMDYSKEDKATLGDIEREYQDLNLQGISNNMILGMLQRQHNYSYSELKNMLLDVWQE